MLPLSLPHRIITAHAPVRDAWRVLHPESSLGPADFAAERNRRRPIPTAAFNVKENGATSDSVYNTWRWAPSQKRMLAQGVDNATLVPHDSIDKQGKRLDYIFFGTGDVPTSDAGWVVKDIRVGMTEPHPTLHCTLSDHFSVEATISFHVVPSQSSPPSPTPTSKSKFTTGATTALTNGTYLQTQASPPPSISGSAPSPDSDLYDRLTAQLRSAALPSPATGESPFSAAAYDELLALISSYTRRERSQRTWRSAHFFASLAILVGCLVAVWFSPHPGVSFALILVGSLSLLAGAVDGLIALLFVGWEIRALREFEWEVMNAKCGGDFTLDALGGSAGTAGSDGEKVVDLVR